VPDFAGLWAIELVDQNGTVYTLQLLVQKVVTTQRGQAISPAYVAASQVETPLHGESLFCDSEDGGALKIKDSAGEVRAIPEADDSGGDSLTVPYSLESAVDTPDQGETLFSDADDSGHLAVKDSAAVVWPIVFQGRQAIAPINASADDIEAPSVGEVIFSDSDDGDRLKAVNAAGDVRDFETVDGIHAGVETTFGAGIDENSVITGDLQFNEWRNGSFVSPPYGQIYLSLNQAITEGVYQAAHQLNPNGGAGSTGRFNALFTVPYSGTWSFTVPAAVPTSTSTFKLLIIDSNLATVLFSQVFTLTTTEQTFSLSSTGLVPGQYYLVDIQVNDTGQQAKPYVGRVKMTPSAFASSGLFSKAWKRIRIHGGMLNGTSHAAQWNAGILLQHSPHADLTFLTNASEFATEVFVNNGGGAGELGCLVDGRELPIDSGITTAQISIRTRTLPASLPRKVRAVTVRAGQGGGANLGTFFRALYLPSSASFSLVPLVSSKRLCIVGDSIANGSSSTIPMYQSWAARIKKRYPGSVVMDTFPSRTFYQEANTAALYKALAMKLAQLQLTDLWLALGVNDYATAPWSAATFGTTYAAFLDFFHGLSPLTRVWCASPIVKAVESANGLGDTLGAFRTVIHTAADDASRVPWAKKIDGSGATGATAGYWPALGDLSGDGVHPGNLGHAKMGQATVVEMDAAGALA
jgi:hypothetical protein